MVVVDDFDEGLHFAALVLSGLAHAAGDGKRVAFDAGDEGVWERVLFATIILRLDDDDFLSCVATAGNDGLDLMLDLTFGDAGLGGCSYHSADLEDC